jgi:DNA polymerase
MPHAGGYPGAAEFVPDDAADLDAVAAAAAGCEGCELFEHATQTVFGRGAPDAHVVLVGEQPGDVEDRRGEPFVGPAGRLLDRALAAAGIEPATVYVTNAVKHFRWNPELSETKRRIHQKPEARHLRACRPWLDAELARLRPDVVVVLGATAGQALFGSGFRVTTARGTAIDWDAPAGAGHTRAVTVVATVHPSAVLRADDREAAFEGLVADLRVAAEQLR